MFSVILPLYNKEMFIERTIQSILMQSYENFELIIVNDGSKDRSLEKVFGIIDQRIKIISIPNGGVSIARNVGLLNAKYDLVSFIDGDDLWHRDYLLEVKRVFDLNLNVKVVYTGFSERATDLNLGDLSCEIVSDYYSRPASERMWTSCVSVHKDCFLKVGYFDTRLTNGEDLDMWARLIKNFEIIRLSSILAIYIKEDPRSLTRIVCPVEKRVDFYLRINNQMKYSERLFWLRHIYDVGGIYWRQKAYVELGKLLIVHRNYFYIFFSWKFKGLFNANINEN